MTEERAAEVIRSADDIASADDAQLEQTIATPEGDTTPPPETVTPPPEPAQQEEVQPAPEPVQPPAESLEERLSKLERQVAEKEAFIQRQAQEVGMLRKIASRPKIDAAKVREEIREQFHQDPVLATKRLRALEQYEEETRRDGILMAIPDLPSLVDTMAAVAKADGERDEVIAAFKADPLKAPVNILHDLAVRARAYRWAKDKEAEIQARYQNPNAQPRVAPTAAAAPSIPAPPAPQRQGSPVIRASTPGGASTTTARFARVTESDISTMSDEELNAFLAKGRDK